MSDQVNELAEAKKEIVELSERLEEMSGRMFKQLNEMNALQTSCSKEYAENVVLRLRLKRYESGG